MIVAVIVLCAILFIIPSYFIGFLQGFKKAKEIDNKIIDELTNKYNT